MINNSPSAMIKLAFTDGGSTKTLSQESLARLHMDGSMTIPGLPKPALECPTDILEKEPAPPRLNLLTPRSDLYPIIPQNIMQASGVKQSERAGVVFPRV